MKKTIAIILIGLTSGCVLQNTKLFSTVQESVDPEYGYTAKKPVTIKNGSLEYSIESSYYFISHLRTEKGNGLELIERASVMNPNFKEGSGPQNLYSGQPIGGNGMLLDMYVLRTLDIPSDTITLFINPYLKGQIKVPNGLKLEN